MYKYCFYICICTYIYFNLTLQTTNDRHTRIILVVDVYGDGTQCKKYTIEWCVIVILYKDKIRCAVWYENGTIILGTLRR